jgi:myosin heavy chain 9/10/11/14
MARPSQAAATEAARAAEFNEKKWVWVPDDKEGYVAGWVHKEEANDGEIILASGGEVILSYLFIKSKLMTLLDAESSPWIPIEDESSQI